MSTSTQACGAVLIEPRTIIWTYNFIVNDVNGNNRIVQLLAVCEPTFAFEIHREALVCASDIVADLEPVDVGAGLDNDPRLATEIPKSP